VLSLLTAMTPSGRLYPVDTRLRPNGRAGSLVSSLDAFAEYQLHHAWTWELQALTRARCIAGDPATVINSPHRREASATGRKRVVPNSDMRNRMHWSWPGRGPIPPNISGGLVDIEWVVQLGCWPGSTSLGWCGKPACPANCALVDIGWLAATDATPAQTARALQNGACYGPWFPAKRPGVDTRAAAEIFTRLGRNTPALPSPKRMPTTWVEIP
jgi:hypothetical protein